MSVGGWFNLLKKRIASKTIRIIRFYSLIPSRVSLIHSFKLNRMPSSRWPQQIRPQFPHSSCRSTHPYIHSSFYPSPTFQLYVDIDGRLLFLCPFRWRWLAAVYSIIVTPVTTKKSPNSWDWVSPGPVASHRRHLQLDRTRERVHRVSKSHRSSASLRDFWLIKIASLLVPPLLSCRHYDFELEQRLQGLRPCFLRPHEVHIDETWLPLQVVWLPGKKSLNSNKCCKWFILQFVFLTTTTCDAISYCVT